MGYYIAGISTFTYRYHDVILSLSENHTNNHYLVRDQLFFSPSISLLVTVSKRQAADWTLRFRIKFPCCAGTRKSSGQSVDKPVVLAHSRNRGQTYVHSNPAVLAKRISSWYIASVRASSGCVLTHPKLFAWGVAGRGYLVSPLVLSQLKLQHSIQSGCASQH